MTHKIILAVIFCFTTILSTFSYAEERQFSRDEWLKLLPSAFTKDFCQEDKIFRVCYSNVTQSKCEEIIKSASKICIGQYRQQIPPKMVKGMGGPWGSKIGECVGITYNQKLQKQFINTDYCNNPSNFSN